MIHLDTNVVIAYLNGDSRIAERLKLALPDVAISAIVLGELLYGARASARAKENVEKVYQLLRAIDAVDFDRDCAEAYSALKVDLRRKGRLTNEVDALIAATALAHNARLVTHNTKHFENITGLQIEDWLNRGG
jgi:tRNA(fMet)-specific endonuclease VapC